jgi:hypothetical protein
MSHSCETLAYRIFNTRFFLTGEGAPGKLLLSDQKLMLSIFSGLIK